MVEALHGTSTGTSTSVQHNNFWFSLAVTIVLQQSMDGSLCNMNNDNYSHHVDTVLELKTLTNVTGVEQHCGRSQH